MFKSSKSWPAKPPEPYHLQWRAERGKSLTGKFLSLENRLCIPRLGAHQRGDAMWTEEARKQHAPRKETLSERYDGCRMGSHRATDPAGRAGWQAAQDGHARGDERGALRFAHRLPMAAVAQKLSCSLRSTVYGYFWEWSRYGALDRIHHALLVACREAEGREASPTAAIIDTQAAKEPPKKGGRTRILLVLTRERRSKASSAMPLPIQ